MLVSFWLTQRAQRFSRRGRRAKQDIKTFDDHASVLLVNAEGAELNRDKSF